MSTALLGLGTSLLGGLLGGGSGGSGGGSGGGGQTQTTSVNTSNTNTFNPNIILGSDVGALTQTGSPTTSSIPSFASSYLPTLGSGVATNSLSTPAVTGSTGLSTTQIVLIAASAVGVILLVSTINKRRSASLSYAPTA